MTKQWIEGSVDARVSALLELAIDAVAQAQILMSRQQAGERAVPLRALSPMELQGIMKSGYTSLIEQRSLPRIGKTGQKGTKILLRLIEEPDHYVSHDELAEAADLRSPTSDAIKVYICYLRDALVTHGYSSDIIETGLHSYRVRTTHVDDVISFLQSL